MVQAAITRSRKVLPHPVSRVNAFLLLYLGPLVTGLDSRNHWKLGR
jgi:hypothetical protein